LRWLSAIVHHTATGTLECFRKAGFSDGQTLLDSDCEYRLLTRGAMSILGSTRRRR
jgi:hypothetical protein